MTEHEFNRIQHRKEHELIEKQWSLEQSGQKQTQEEKDLFNLQYMRYGIMHGSLYYRCGCIASLDRAIKRLEKEREKNADK